MIFQEKMFFMIYFTSWSNFMAWLTLLLEILGNMHIPVNCFPGFDVKFEINLIFLIKPFFCIIKKSRQKFKYLENKKNSYDEMKCIFIFRIFTILEYTCNRSRLVVNLQARIKRLYGNVLLRRHCSSIL